MADRIPDFRTPSDFTSPSAAAEPGDEMTILVDSDTGSATVIDPGSGAAKTANEDGSVTIDLNPAKPTKQSPTAHDANLAEHMEAMDLSRIGGDLLQAIEADNNSRQQWLNTRAKGIDMLGFKIEEPRGDAGASTSPVEGMSTVRHPLLAEAVIRFQANAAAELLPAEGPVKVRDDSNVPPTPAPSPPAPQGAPPAPTSSAPGTPQPGMGSTQPAKEPSGLPPVTRFDLAEALEKGFNHILTVVDKGYRPDTERMLFWVGFGGCGFKKVYHCPIRRMPISRSVDAADLIVSDAANDINDAGRITHVQRMRKSTMVRMQIAGVYRQIASNLPQPQEQPNAVEQKIAVIQGFNANPQRPEDMDYTIYECYCELDLPGFEHEDEDGNPTGLALPYRVSIDKDSREILEIRRNWREDDPNCLSKQVFVKYPFRPTFGFYDTGLLQLLGNSDRALTGAWRLALDAAMFSNFPGFIYSDVLGRQLTNEFRVPPGGGVKINTGGKPISDVVMALPYKDVSNGMALIIKAIEEGGQRLGGTAELQVAEGRQDAPVGTTLAMIEQATKMLAAVHIGLHAAQAEEFQLLKERYKEDPEAFWRHGQTPAKQWEVEEFLAALNDYDMVPAADPNTPSHMHRIMKAVAIKQLQMANPQLYDGRAVDTLILRMIGINPTGLFSDPSQQQQGPSPQDMAALAKLQLQQQELQLKASQAAADQKSQENQDNARMNEVGTESADRAADRQSRERVAQTRDRMEQTKALGEMVDKGLLHPAVLLHHLGIPLQFAGSHAVGHHSNAAHAWTYGQPPAPPPQQLAGGDQSSQNGGGRVI